MSVRVQKVKRIMQVALTVDDLDKGITFYRDVLGLPMLFQAPGMAFFESGGVRIMLGTENPSGQATFLYFEVDDIQAAADELAARGAAFESAPRKIAELEDRDVWLAAFRDPAGTLHHLMSEVGRTHASGKPE